ncbi:MAG: SDR family NAD(P)-dependent oxidoreductase [Syntrophobacteraceae bacterium]
MARLAGKIAVITGGGGDIGAETAKLFVKEGATVLLVDINEEACQKVIKEIGSSAASCCVADVTKPDQVQAYVQTAVDRYGGIDVFLGNAGIDGVVSTIHEYPVDVFQKVIDVNIIGVFLGLKYVIPAMIERGGGSCILTSSIAGLKGSPAMCAYVTSKHALIGLARTAAVEYGACNIRVNCINPGCVESQLMRSVEEGYVPFSLALSGTQLDRQGVHDDIASKIPMKRYATTEDVSRLMLFLASDDSRYCSGSFYMVDGGMTAV